jgi:hypothetical protein
MFLFSDLQSEVKRRATRDQSGSDFTTAVSNIINTSLFRLAREAPWRCLRRTATFDTVTSYTTGSGAVAVTKDSKNVTVTGATFLTNGVKTGRYIKIGGSAKYYKVATITGETTLTLNEIYSGDTSTTETYEILPQEEYVLPIQASHRIFLWHREWGYPQPLSYIPSQTFYRSGRDDIMEGIPEEYHMWGEDMVLAQPLEGSVMRVASSDSADVSIGITVFGTVGGYPDYEEITTNASNGTTAASGSKVFTSVERVTKDAATTGRITVDCNTAAVTVAVLPVGDTTAGTMYRKVRLYPLPNSVFPVNVYFYKDPYRLVNNDDIHELGQEFDEAIILLSVAKIKYESSQEEGNNWFGLYKDEIRNLKKTNVDKPDWLLKLGRPNPSTSDYVHPNLQYRQVGPYFGRRI